MKYRVVFITTSDLSGKSGHNVATREIVESFILRDDVELILISPKPAVNIGIENTKIKAYYYDSKFRLSRLPFNKYLPITNIISQIQIYLTFKRLLKTTKPTFIVARLANLFFSINNIYHYKNIPLFLLVRGKINFNTYKFRLFNKFNSKITITNIRIATNVYVAYDYLKSTYSKYKDEDQIRVFNNAINPRKFQILSRNESRIKYISDLCENDFVVGFVGSLKTRHNVDKMLYALEEILKNKVLDNTKAIKILIVGDGDQKKNLNTIVKNSDFLSDINVKFIGFVHHVDVYKYISCCDILYGVVDNDHSSNPIKCYEYLACNKPIITSRTEDFKFIEDIKCGILLDSVNVSTVTKAILSLYELDNHKLIEMGKRGREYVYKNHTWDKLPSLIIEDYSKIT